MVLTQCLPWASALKTVRREKRWTAEAGVQCWVDKAKCPAHHAFCLAVRDRPNSCLSRRLQAVACQLVNQRRPNRPCLTNHLKACVAYKKDSRWGVFYQPQVFVDLLLGLKTLFLTRAPLLLKTIITMPKCNDCVFLFGQASSNLLSVSWREIDGLRQKRFWSLRVRNKFWTLRVFFAFNFRIPSSCEISAANEILVGLKRLIWMYALGDCPVGRPSLTSSVQSEFSALSFNISGYLLRLHPSHLILFLPRKFTSSF